MIGRYESRISAEESKGNKSLWNSIKLNDSSSNFLNENSKRLETIDDNKELNSEQSSKQLNNKKNLGLREIASEQSFKNHNFLEQDQELSNQNLNKINAEFHSNRQPVYNQALYQTFGNEKQENPKVNSENDMQNKKEVLNKQEISKSPNKGRQKEKSKKRQKGESLEENQNMQSISESNTKSMNDQNAKSLGNLVYSILNQIVSFSTILAFYSTIYC